MSHGLPLLDWQPEKPKPVTYKDKAPTRCARLREFMADGRWVSLHELMRVGGTRAPARLWSISRGEDGGPPTPYEVRRDPSDTTMTFYRFVVAP